MRLFYSAAIHPHTGMLILLPSLKQNLSALITPLPATEKVSDAAKYPHGVKINQAWRKAVSLKQFEKYSIGRFTGDWKFVVQKLVEHIMHKGCVIGLWSLCDPIGDAIRYANHYVPNGKFWCAAIPGIFGEYFCGAVWMNFQPTPAISILECASSREIIRQVLLDVVGKVLVQDVNPF